jgi:hypothetical protein
MVTSPNVQSNIAGIAEFEKQGWIQDILKANPAGQQDNKKTYVDPNVVFPFQDNFSVGTIHGASTTKSPAAPTSKITAPTSSAAAGLPCNQNTTIEILDNDREDEMSLLTTKNTGGAGCSFGQSQEANPCVHWQLGCLQPWYPFWKRLSYHAFPL